MILLNKCIDCKSDKTGKMGWYKKGNNKQCNRCYMRERRRKNGEFKDFKKHFNERFCSECGSTKTQVTTTKKGYPHTKWISDGNNGHLCHKCSKKILYQQRETEYYKARFSYKGKPVHIGENPRTGHCAWCTNNIFDKSCKNTHIHHFNYNDNNPLKDTIELCGSCHTKETRRIDKENEIYNLFEKSIIIEKSKELEKENLTLKQRIKELESS